MEEQFKKIGSVIEKIGSVATNVGSVMLALNTNLEKWMNSETMKKIIEFAQSIPDDIQETVMFNNIMELGRRMSYDIRHVRYSRTI